MPTARYTAHYWTSHCEHCVGFDTIGEAYDFLRAGTRAHSMAVDSITTTDGAVVVSREELLGISPCRAAVRKQAHTCISRAAGQH